MSSANIDDATLGAIVIQQLKMWWDPRIIDLAGGIK